MEANDELQRTLEKEGFVTVSKAVELLQGVRRGSIYRWAASNQIASRRVGHLMFVLREDVERMLGLRRAG